MAKHGTASSPLAQDQTVGTYIECADGVECLVVSIEGETPPAGSKFLENIRTGAVSPCSGGISIDVGTFDYVLVTVPLHITPDAAPATNTLADVPAGGFCWISGALHRQITVKDENGDNIDPPSGKVWVREYDGGAVTALVSSTAVTHQAGQILDWKLS